MKNSPKPIPLTWFQRPAVEVAADLPGQWLCSRLPDGTGCRQRITEVEAYVGPEDTACHAHRGKTGRNQIMYEKGGCWYVYLCYGVHWLLNITTGPADHPQAVLLRGTEEVSGPGRLTKSMKIDAGYKNLPATPESGL